MANKVKPGLEYFPLEVTFFDDIKIRKLIKYQGCKSLSIYTLLLCLIYKNGYYMLWDQELPFIISEKIGCEEGYIKEVINSCFSIGLFNKQLFDENKVITSKGIQERYADICKQCNKKAKISEFNLIISEEKTIKSEEMGIKSEGMAIKSEEKTQSKVKESKGNITSSSTHEQFSNFSEQELDDVENHQPFLSQPAQELAQILKERKPNAPTIEKVKEIFRRQGGTDEMAEKFFGENDTAGWVDKYFRPIKTIDYLVGKYITNWHNNLKNNPNHGKQSTYNRTSTSKASTNAANIGTNISYD
jgi:hypothetical protein